MTLLSAVTKLQNIGSSFYIQLSKDFAENSVIRDTWVAMAQDMEKQADSLKALSHSFWRELQQQEEVQKAVAQASSQHKPQDGDHTLQHRFIQTLDFEEPLILNLYVPIIRQLRSQWTGHVLDFYIMVKAHVVRLTRLIQPFSGDPALVGRSLNLLHNFEKGVQVPQILPELRFSVGKPPARMKAPQKATPHPRTAERRIDKTRTKRAKRLLKKIEIPRRRARG